MNKYNLSLKFKINNKYNQVNNNSDIEYIKNVMQSIITKYE